MTAVPSVVWWGHSTTTVRLPGATVLTDPLLTDRLFHLRRHAPVPADDAATADVVLISHLHRDHLHLPSLDRIDRSVPVLVPRGAPLAVPGIRGRELLEVEPGDAVDVAGVRIDVLPARHSGARSEFERRHDAPALGFRFGAGDFTVWYPGDTGVQDLSDVAAVDLAIVPIGGWGPTLGDDHLDPEEAVAAVATVGARWALAVHYGTYWPMWLRRLRPANHRRLFVSPPERFHRAARDTGLAAVPLTPAFGEDVVLAGTPSVRPAGPE